MDFTSQRDGAVAETPSQAGASSLGRIEAFATPAQAGRSGSFVVDMFGLQITNGDRHGDDPDQNL